MSGLYAIAGHGILRDLPLNPQLIGDQIPVDFVSNQLLAALAYQVQQFRESAGKARVALAAAPLRLKFHVAPRPAQLVFSKPHDS